MLQVLPGKGCTVRRMAYHALLRAQARLDQLQTLCDGAFTAYEVNPSNDLKKERYEDLILSLHKAGEIVDILASAICAASTSGPQTYCAPYSPACVHFCYLCAFLLSHLGEKLQLCSSSIFVCVAFLQVHHQQCVCPASLQVCVLRPWCKFKLPVSSAS